MKDANVVRLDRVVPVPRFAVHLLMCKLVDALDVLEVVAIEVHRLGVLGCAVPRCDAEQAQLFLSLQQVVVESLEAFSNLFASWGEVSHGVVELRAEVEDNNLLRCWVCAISAVRVGELS